MQISGRNKLRGRVKHIDQGTVMAEVVVDIGGHEVVAAITKDSVAELHLQTGDEVTALVKATSVMIMK